MPGQRWLQFARAWFDERTVELVIEPLIADWRHEQSSAAGWRAVVVTLRGQLAVLSSTLACFFAHAWKPLPTGLGSSAWTIIEGFAALGALVLIVPFVSGEFPSAVDAVALVPAALCLSLPLSTVPTLILVSARSSTPP